MEWLEEKCGKGEWEKAGRWRRGGFRGPASLFCGGVGKKRVVSIEIGIEGIRRHSRGRRDLGFGRLDLGVLGEKGCSPMAKQTHAIPIWTDAPEGDLVDVDNTFSTSTSYRMDLRCVL